MAIKKARDSKSGKYISPDQAKANPETTTVEVQRTMMTVTRYFRDGSFRKDRQRVGTPIELSGEEIRIEVD